MRTNLLLSTCLVLAVLALTACTPEPPPTDQPPEPKVTAGEATELRDAIQQPIDAAKAVGEVTRQAAEDQQAAIDAAAH